MAKEDEVQRLLENLRTQFGANWGADQLQAVRERLAAMLDAGEQMRKVVLDNATGPLSVFIPYRRDE